MFPSAFRFFQVAKVQSFLFTSFFSISACSPGNSSGFENDCEVRIYHEQTLVSDKPLSHKKLQPKRLNFSPFLEIIPADQWILDGQVAMGRDETWSYSSPAVGSFGDLSESTTFLAIVVDDPASYVFKLEDYFDESEAAKHNVSEACSIYIGDRAGQHALAMVRRSDGVEVVEENLECTIVATLLFFGFNKSKAIEYENYVSMGVLPRMFTYKFDLIHAELKKQRDC